MIGIRMRLFFIAIFACAVAIPAWSQDLTDAVLSGDLEAVREALPEGTAENPELLVRPLYFASRDGNEEVILYLLDQGAPPDAKIRSGSALQIAARNNHAGIVKLLLDRGADANARGGDFGNAPIHDAAERGAMDSAKVLLEHGADINLRRSTGDQPAIHLAVRRGRDEMVSFLLENGAEAFVTEPVTETEFAATDPEMGRARAEECLFCHSLEQGKMPSTKFAGPDLAGLLGREKAVRDYFDYSSAMKAVGGTWTVEELNRFIADPTGVVPGTTMERGSVRDRSERIGLIKYLVNEANNGQRD